MLRISVHGEVTRFELARTLAGRGRYWTSAYLVGGVLIDTGCAHTARELVDHMADTPVRTILNTHTHEDHIGANGLFQGRNSNLEIRVHPDGLPVLTHPRGRQPLRPYQKVMWGWPQPSEGRPMDDGDVIEVDRYSFQVLYTPGHANDHVCLFEPDRGWLFTGDLYVGGRERALRADYEIWQIIASLKRIASLPITVMFPGSARVRHSPGQRIRDKIEYLEELGERILVRRDRGASVGQIVRELCGPPMLMEAITLGHFSRRALVESYLRCARNKPESEDVTK
jgi:glyoxylase-like metal-dependent hydrolase (beta-lactamase superfamily II)